MTARRFALFGLLGLALTSAPRAAAAQQFSFQNYCTTGSLQLCASIELSFTPIQILGHDVTQLVLRVRNLQGTLGSTTPWGLAGLGIAGMKTDHVGVFFAFADPPTFSGTAHRVCNTSGLPFACGGFSEWDGTASNGVGSFGKTLGPPPWMYPVVGCGLPTLPGGSQGWGLDGYIQTCGDGWAEFTVNLAGNWEFTEGSTIGLAGFTDAGDFSCTLGTTCIQATPEPVTIVLLGSGLTGLAAIRSRRRKQDGDV